MAWDRQKLEALRGKFSDADGGDMLDPQFRKVAAKMFSQSGTRLAPYAGVPTFVTAPHLPVDPDNPISAIFRWPFWACRWIWE